MVMPLDGSMWDQGTHTATVITTSLASIITGYLLGVYSIRGYLISPELAEERRRNLNDPIESDESDVDLDDVLMDHAPNWANGLEADRKQGLRAAAPAPVPALSDNKEECKLVLVVRTDLGMTKGERPC